VNPGLDAVLTAGNTGIDKTLYLTETLVPANTLSLSSTTLAVTTSTNTLTASANEILLLQSPYETDILAGSVTMKDGTNQMDLLPGVLRFVGSPNTEYTSAAMQGNFDVSGNVTFLSSPTVPTPPANDVSTKVASTYFVQNALNSFVQAGTTGTVAPTGTYQVAFGITYPFIATPHILVTPLDGGSTSVSSSPAPTATDFTCNLAGGCTGFNWVAMAI